MNRALWIVAATAIAVACTLVAAEIAIIALVESRQ